MVLRECDAQVVASERTSMLGGQVQFVLTPAEIEVRIPPCVEFARPAELLSRSASSTTLACMVDDQHSDLVLALEAPQEAEDRGDLAGLILVRFVQPHERIEDQEPGLHFSTVPWRRSR